MENLFITRPVLGRLVLLLLAASTLLAACSKDDAYTKAIKDHEAAQKLLDEAAIKQYLTNHQLTTYQRLESGVYLVPLAEGPGSVTAAAKNRVQVKYLGMHIDGTVFENSFDNRTPCQCGSFLVGSGIKGFDEALTHMKKGDRKLALIPSALAYGSGGSGTSIGPDEVLVFDLEVTSIE